MLLITNRTKILSEKKELLITRIKALDTVRGFATYVMIIYHFVSWFLPQLPQYNLIHFTIITLLGKPFRFCFITIPSMGVILQLYTSRKQGIDENKLKKSILKRGLILIIIQFFCNFFGLYPVLAWNSFIISFIGISIITAYYISKISHRIRIILIIIICMITPFLKFYLFPLQFSVNLFQATWSIDSFLYNMFLQVDFPILPYIAYSIFGTIYIDKMIKAIETNSQGKFIKNTLIIGIILIILYSVLSNFNSIINFPDFILNIPSRQDLFFSCGSVMLIISTFFWIQDWKGQNLKAFIPLEVFGSISLTVYITHYYFFPKLIGSLYNPWGKLNAYSVFQLAFILYVLYVIYGIVVLRRNRKYSIEWLLRSFV